MTAREIVIPGWAAKTAHNRQDAVSVHYSTDDESSLVYVQQLDDGVLRTPDLVIAIGGEEIFIDLDTVDLASLHRLRDQLAAAVRLIGSLEASA